MIMKNCNCLWVTFLILCVLVLPSPAQPEHGRIPPADTKAAEKTRAAEAMNRIQQPLDEALALANEFKRPMQQSVDSWQKMLDESRRYISLAEDNKQKASYHLLQCWVAYFKNDLETAHQNAVRACRLDATSKDAWISQVAMAVLTGREPAVPRPPRPARVQRNRPPQAGMESPETARGTQESAAQIQKGKLDFDLNLFLPEAVGKKIEPLHLNCLNGTTFNYQPDNEALCVLFWRKSENKTAMVGNDPNTPARTVPPVMTAEPMMEYGMLNAGDGYGRNSERAFLAAFGKLFQAGLPSGRVKFLAVNSDSMANKQAVVDEMIERPQPWAQVIVADQQGNFFSNLGLIQIGRPVLMMTDMSGTVRYAGPATGIIAPMLLSKIASAADFAPSEATQERIEPSSIPTDANSVSHIKPMDGNSLPQTGPVAQPPQPIQRPTRQPTVPQQGQYKELSEENKIQAERKLEVAKDLFMPLGRKMGMTYKRGVEICREIMREYPGSEYAEQARQLLRQVPENQRSRYGITDQELGL